MSRETTVRHIEFDENGISVSAALISELLRVPEREVQALMAAGEITSRLERGVDADAGRHRLTFLHRGRRARLTIDDTGRILKRSVVDAGAAPGAGTAEGGATPVATDHRNEGDRT